MESNIGSELTYVLSENYLSHFEDMLRDLEANSSALGIRNYGISLATLEEIFVKLVLKYFEIVGGKLFSCRVGADHVQEDEKQALEGVQLSSLQTRPPYDTRSNNFIRYLARFIGFT